jgi:hypothetical protein
MQCPGGSWLETTGPPAGGLGLALAGRAKQGEPAGSEGGPEVAAVVALVADHGLPVPDEDFDVLGNRGSERLPIAASWLGEVQPPATRVSVRYCRKVSGTSRDDSRIVAAIERREKSARIDAASLRRLERLRPDHGVRIVAGSGLRWLSCWRVA